MIDYEKLSSLMELVNKQAEDEGLWFIAEYVSEDCLQRALRTLHSAIEDLIND